MTTTSRYVHGTHPEEQRRLADLNALVNQATLDAIRPGRGERTLDVGSGLGQLARSIARATGERVVGIDRSAAQIARARTLAAAQGESGFVEFREGDAMELPLASHEWGMFDLAHARFLLEHLPKPQVVVNAMARAVKPGGRVVLCDDDHDAVRLWPEPPGMPDLWHAYVETYARNGNDAFIGRKLVAMLYEAGLEPRRIAMPMFGACAGEPAFPACVTNLAGIFEGARDAILATGRVSVGAFEAAQEALRDWGRRPDATFWYTLSLAEGRKP